MKQVLLFDFDGTLFDTGPGVMNCVVYALEHLGVRETDPQKLRKFMGPPLYDMFRELYGLDDAQGHEAVRLYRERYQPTGIWECAPYPGITELLQKLRHIDTIIYTNADIWDCSRLAAFQQIPTRQAGHSRGRIERLKGRFRVNVFLSAHAGPPPSVFPCIGHLWPSLSLGSFCATL